jgi:GNAT superfamily N-acetyltransferase
METVRYADRPDLRERRFAELSGITFPTYMHHNEVGPRYWGRLYDDFPDFQVALVKGDELLAEAHAVPVAWDGSVESLPSGWDEAFELGMTSGEAPTALCALAISVSPGHQGEGLSGRMIGTFTANARTAGLTAVIAPVRPTLKERYPLIAIERYVEWRRDDGAHFDPWIRVHERVGGEILAPAPRSMTIRAPVADWEQWTGMRFPEDGTYVFPGGLAPLAVAGGTGTHVEPNVWMRHPVA